MRKKSFNECYQKHDWNKRARGMKTIFGHSARKIILAKNSGQKMEVEWYCNTVQKLLLQLVIKIKIAEEPKAFYILRDGFDNWLKLIDYPIIESDKVQMLKKE